MKLLALGHRKRTGKDTIARFMVTYLRTHTKNLNIQKAGFADKIKQQTHELFGWAGLQEGPYYDANPTEREIILPAIGKTPRELWIEYGNKLREIYPNVWIDFLLNKRHCDILIITDLRYPNEFNKIKDTGGICVRVDRPEIAITHDIADDALQDCTEWDYIVNNYDSLNKLNIEAEWLAQKLM